MLFFISPVLPSCPKLVVVVVKVDMIIVPPFYRGGVASCSCHIKHQMISIRGTKLVRLQRRKQGLDFSIKGGREHGIGVVVSWIKEGGAAGKA